MNGNNLLPESSQPLLLRMDVSSVPLSEVLAAIILSPGPLHSQPLSPIDAVSITQAVTRHTGVPVLTLPFYQVVNNNPFCNLLYPPSPEILLASSLALPALGPRLISEQNHAYSRTSSRGLVDSYAHISLPPTQHSLGTNKNTKATDRNTSRHNFTNRKSRTKADVTQSSPAQSSQQQRSKAGRHNAFPEQLYHLLEDLSRQGNDDIASWAYQGRAFQVHQPDKFVETVLPKYFRQKSLNAFRRQLQNYCFERVSRRGESFVYAHQYFLRDNLQLLERIRRVEPSTDANIEPRWVPDFGERWPMG